MIYLDNHATTRCDPRVLEAMLPYFSEHYGNASSAGHALGWTAEAALDLAREEVAEALGANSNEIVFCSGATEANTLALRGAAYAYRERGRHIVVGSTEHASVLDCAAQLQALKPESWQVSQVPVAADGIIDPELVRKALRPETTIVSVMLVNNEIGVIQDIAALAALVHAADPAIIFHCDAAQALGRVPIDVTALGVDLLTVSAHKIYGPKGVGALWRRRRPRLKLSPLMAGGGQEFGLRAGTVPVPLVVGFGKASSFAVGEMAEETLRITALRDHLLTGLRLVVPNLSVNGSMDHRVAGNLNIAIEGISANSLITAVAGQLALSTGSACSSATGKPSHVLAAIVSAPVATSSIRFGIGRFTTNAEIDEAIAVIGGAVANQL